MLEALQSNYTPIEPTIPIVQSQETTPLPETNIDKTVAVVQQNNQSKNTKNIILASSIIGGLVSAYLVFCLILNQKQPSNFESRITKETVKFKPGTRDFQEINDPESHYRRSQITTGDRKSLQAIANHYKRSQITTSDRSASLTRRGPRSGNGSNHRGQPIT